MSTSKTAVQDIFKLISKNGYNSDKTGKDIAADPSLQNDLRLVGDFLSEVEAAREEEANRIKARVGGQPTGPLPMHNFTPSSRPYP